MTDGSSSESDRDRSAERAARQFELRTDRLRMRPYRAGDAAALHALWTHPIVRRYLFDDEVIGLETVKREIEANAECFERHGLGQFCVLERGGRKTPIGFCGYRFFRDPPELELLFGLHPDRHGRGLATEAARCMLRFGFERGLDRVVASTDAANVASQRVLERIGMRRCRRATVDGLDTIFYEKERVSHATPASPPPG